MIYLKPQTPAEAAEAFEAETSAGRTPVWYSGGTEIITFLRKGTLKTETVIDLKGLPGYMALTADDSGWTIGAGIPLNRLSEAGLPKILGVCTAPIADHTVRNRLSLGGNLCGRLPYREAVLPLLALGARVTAAGPQGLYEVPLADQFNRSMNLPADTFLYQIHIPRPDPGFVWGSSRKVRLGAVDYPIVHVLTAEDARGRALYISGLCPYPIGLQGLTEEAMQHPEALPLPTAPQEDRLASRAYRLQLFKLALKESLSQTGGPL